MTAKMKAMTIGKPKKKVKLFITPPLELKNKGL